MRVSQVLILLVLVLLIVAMPFGLTMAAAGAEPYFTPAVALPPPTGA